MAYMKSLMGEDVRDEAVKLLSCQAGTWSCMGTKCRINCVITMPVESGDPPVVFRIAGHRAKVQSTIKVSRGSSP